MTLVITRKTQSKRGRMRRSVIYARLRSLVSRYRLPPGEWVRLDELEKANRCFLLEQAGRVGPIFKAIAWDEFWVCIVGLPMGRQLLREHGADLRPVTLKLEPLFPKGFLRQMQGEDHRHYRKAIMRATSGEDLAAAASSLAKIADEALASYAKGSRDKEDAAADYIRTLNAIASGMLIRLFFGVEPGTEPFERILQGYHQLGPYGLVWNLGPQQHEAFAGIRDYLLGLFAGAPEMRPAGSEKSILGQLADVGVLDATMLGNLIYMVEMGRYDTYSLFRWLTKYGADHPDLLEKIASEDLSMIPAGGRSLNEAFVLETLRMDQSERLVRKAQRDFVFAGHLIPKHAHVRVCMWESHKAHESFPDPFRFDPNRFLGTSPGGDQFSPFGLDSHHCPFGDMAIRTSMIFLRTLARSYVPITLDDGPPVKGMFHWEPASRFGVELVPRTKAG
jgi:cytochrome P450